MIDRGGLFGVPGYRWIPARQRVTVQYAAVLEPATVRITRPCGGASPSTADRGWEAGDRTADMGTSWGIWAYVPLMPSL